MRQDHKNTYELGAQERQLYNHGSGHTQTIASLCFCGAEGDYIYDTDGGRYVDFNGTLNLPLGHSWSNARRVMAENIPLNAVSYATTSRLELCKLLESLFPSYTAFQFYSAGTEANEGAIRYAIAITGKDSFASFRKSYHGRTRATVSMCNMKDYNGNRLPGYFRVIYPSTEEEARRALADLDEMIRMDYGRNCAGVFLEPVQGKTVVEPPSGFLCQLKEKICDKYGLMLIADEYLTSMRSGTFSVCMEQGVEPDIMTIGKCLGNGIPFAVLLCHKKHADRVWHIKGSTTFGGNPFACATVAANLKQIMGQNLLNRTVDTIERIFREETRGLESCPIVQGVRAKGALLGIEFKNKALCMSVSQRCLRSHILVSCIGPVIRITPSFTIDETLFAESLRTICGLIREEAIAHE